MADASAELSSDDALGVVQDYAAEQESKGVGDDLARYGKRSAQFAAIGGALGSVVPGIGTAIGGLGGAAAGVIVEGASDIIDALSDDEPKHTHESPADAERAFQTYQALGGLKGTKLEYKLWWKLYVESGRPPLEVIEAGRKAQRAAEQLADTPRPPPPPPPPPKRSKETTDLAVRAAIADAEERGASKEETEAAVAEAKKRAKEAGGESGPVEQAAKVGGLVTVGWLLLKLLKR